MPRLRRVLTTVPTMAAAVALALTAGPASAATDRHDDPARDSVVDDGAGGVQSHPQKFGDITGVTTKHDGDAVVITTSFRTVTANGLVLIDRIVTPDNEYVTNFDGLFGTQTVSLSDENGNDVACPGLAIKFSGKQDTAKVTVPRSCLDRPATVRTGSLSLVPEMGGARAGRRLVTAAYDDARRNGTVSTSVKVGPKVAHN